MDYLLNVNGAMCSLLDPFLVCTENEFSDIHKFNQYLHDQLEEVYPGKYGTTYEIEDDELSRKMAKLGIAEETYITMSLGMRDEKAKAFALELAQQIKEGNVSRVNIGLPPRVFVLYYEGTHLPQFTGNTFHVSYEDEVVIDYIRSTNDCNVYVVVNKETNTLSDKGSRGAVGVYAVNEYNAEQLLTKANVLLTPNEKIVQINCIN